MHPDSQYYPTPDSPTTSLPIRQQPQAGFVNPFTHIDPAFARPIRPAPAPSSREWKLAMKLDRLIVDAADRMEIPRADGAHGIAQELSQQLYAVHRQKLLKNIPHEPSHADDPGTVLVGAIKQFAIAVFGLGYTAGRLDIERLQSLLTRLEAFCTDYPPNGDVRRWPVNSLRILIERLLSYYR